MNTPSNKKIRVRYLLGQWFFLWVPLLMLSSLSIFNSYQVNFSVTSVQDLYIPLLLNGFVATIIATLAFRPFLKNGFVPYTTALLITLILSTSFQSHYGGIFSTVNSFLPFSIPNPIFLFIYLGLLVYVVFRCAAWLEGFLKARKFLSATECMRAEAGIVITVFLAGFIPVAGDLAQAWPQFFYTPPALTAVHPTAAQAAAKPDVYFIMLEDYASQSVLKNQMGYDNSGFLNSLASKGFYNVPDAYANYPYTVNSTASTFDANYLSDQVNKFSGSANQTLLPYFSTIRDSPVIRQLKSMGYTYELLGDWYETSDYSPLADANYTNNRQVKIFNHLFPLNEFGNTEIQQNPLWSLLSNGMHIGSYTLFSYISQSDIDAITSQISELKTLAAQPAGGRFIFSEILLPHNYFYFNADGSLSDNPGPDNQGKLATQKYTDNVQVVNGLIEPVIDEIMKNSQGKADIILQSDEGPQPGQMKLTYDSVDLHEPTSNMTTWSQADLQMKFGVLASYYIPGASQADLAQGANPVNVFRLLLNTNNGASLPYLPQCYYAFPQGENQSFVYQNINQKLTGTANAACPQNGNFIKPGATKLMGISHPVSTSNGDND